MVAFQDNMVVGELSGQQEEARIFSLVAPRTRPPPPSGAAKKLVQNCKPQNRLKLVPFP